jgi:hypothetical protein
MATSIADDLREWSMNVLEVPNSHLDGLPACPYAKKAWQDNKVKIVETKNIYKETLRQCTEFTDNRYEVVVCASFTIPNMQEFSTWCEERNNLLAKQDLHIMGFHPEFGAEEAELDFLYEHSWESSVKDEYCMVFIQSLSQVDDASLKLEKLDYYKVYPEDEYQELVINRRTKRNGNETQSNEKENDARWRSSKKASSKDDARRRSSKETSSKDDARRDYGASGRVTKKKQTKQH